MRRSGGTDSGLHERIGDVRNTPITRMAGGEVVIGQVFGAEFRGTSLFHDI
jgi:hypothetical protein